MEFVRQMCGLLLLLIAKRTVDGLSIIRGNRKTAIGVELTLICQDDGFITQSVDFLKNTLLQGGCSTSCGTGITGYAVSQNRTAKETYLTISSLEESRDGGDWTCKQGTDAVSSPFTINNTLPCFINASSDITVTPPVSSLSSPDNISVNVSVPCCSETDSVEWTYQKQNEAPVKLGSNTSVESCPAGEKLDIFQPQRNAFPLSGEVTLTLTIKHDSFKPPDYTVVSTTKIDLGVAPAPVPCDCDCALIAVVILVVLLVVKIVTDGIFIAYRWEDKCKQIINTDRREHILYWICFVQGIIDSICGVACFIVICAVCTECLGEGLPIAALVLCIIVVITGVINIVMCCCLKSSDPGKSDDPSPWLCCCCLGTIHPEEKSSPDPPPPSSLPPIPPSMASPRKPPVPPSSTTPRALPSPTSDPASDSAVNPSVHLEPLSVEEPKKKKKKRKKRKNMREAGEESSDQPMNPTGDSDE